MGGGRRWRMEGIDGAAGAGGAGVSPANVRKAADRMMTAGPPKPAKNK